MAVEETKDTNIERTWVAKPGGIPEVYSNFVHSSWSLYDVRILFGQLKPTLGNAREFIVEEQAAVTITWPHAKSVLALLSGMVEAYESVNGKIEKATLAPRYEDIEK